MFLPTTMDDTFGELQEQSTALARYDQDAAREGPAEPEVEEERWARVLKMGQQAFGHFRAEQGGGDGVDTFTCRAGRGGRRYSSMPVARGGSAGTRASPRAWRFE